MLVVREFWEHGTVCFVLSGSHRQEFGCHMYILLARSSLERGTACSHYLRYINTYRIEPICSNNTLVIIPFSWLVLAFSQGQESQIK